MARRKRYIDEELADIMNTTGAASDICGGESDLENEENEINDLEVDLLYDSDEDKEYVPKLGVCSDESSDEEDYSKKKKRTKRLTSTPFKRRAPDFSTASTSADHSLAPVPNDHASSLAPTASTSATPPATARGSHQRDIPPVVKFDTTTIATPSNFRWSCRPQIPASVRTPTRNIMSAYSPGPTPGAARNAVSPEEAFCLYFNYDIIQIIVT